MNYDNEEFFCQNCGRYSPALFCLSPWCRAKANKKRAKIESAGTSRRSVTNTTKQDPIVSYLDAFDGDISASEARGQREVVEAMVLPSVMDQTTRDALTKAGVVLGAQVPGDKLFLNATLPIGWKKRSTDHYMYSDLVDEKGRIRASIMYKAAAYDRDASISIRRRYGFRYDYDAHVAVVTNCGVEIHRTARNELAHQKNSHIDSEFLSYMRAQEALLAEAGAWLDAKYPDWKDASAYWGE